MQLIAVAERSALEVWRVASRAIRNSIDADAYRVIVPERDFYFFADLVDSKFIVESEEDYISEFSKYLRDAIGGTNPDRFGWYLQQLIKLEALRRTGEMEEAGLIWDADTVPLQNLSFFEHGKAKLIYGTECHSPYFETIGRLLGLHRIVSYSFIAQCFPCKPHWIRDFCDTIQERHGVPWWQAVIDSIDFRERSGFSEYEALGTFISHHYPDEWIWDAQHWVRNGYSIFGSPARAVRLAGGGNKRPDIAFAAFETWERKKKLEPAYRRMFRSLLTSLFSQPPRR